MTTQIEIINSGLMNFSQAAQDAIGKVCSLPAAEAVTELEAFLQVLHADPWGNGRSLETYSKQAGFIRMLADSFGLERNPQAERQNKLGKIAIEQLRETIKDYPKADQDEILAIAQLPKAEAIPALEMRIKKLKADTSGKRSPADYRAQIRLMRDLIDIYRRM